MRAPDVLEEARALVPGLEPAPGRVRRSVKCVLVPCAVRGRAAIVKKLYGPDAPWRWYLAREIALGRAFARDPPPVRVPRLLAGDAARGLVVMERLSGRPLGAVRHDPRGRAVASDEAWRTLLELRCAIAAWSPPATITSAPAPDAATRAEMRARLLEDPSAPLAWAADGLARCAALGLLDARDAARLTHAIDADGARFQHGDLLLRNVVCDREGALAVVDWECAGPHPRAWDAALLSVWAPRWAREALRAEHAAEAFDACAAFALARELAFRRSRGASDPVSARLRADLAALLARTPAC